MIILLLPSLFMQIDGKCDIVCYFYFFLTFAISFVVAACVIFSHTRNISLISFENIL